MICKKCGNEIAENSLICPMCGTAESVVWNTQGDLLKKKAKKAFISAIICYCIHFLCYGFLSYDNTLTALELFGKLFGILVFVCALILAFSTNKVSKEYQELKRTGKTGNVSGSQYFKALKETYPSFKSVRKMQIIIIPIVILTIV